MQKFSRCAVIGGGFSGLAVCKALLDRFPGLDVTLLDPNGYGGEASKMSTGLLHKYVGLHSKLNPFGVEGESATKRWIEEAAEALQRPLILSKGILRVAMNETQKMSYEKASKTYPDMRWLTPDETKNFDAGLPALPALFIQSGSTVDVEGYLQGLFVLCQNKGLQLKKECITALDELNSFDAIFLATGASRKIAEVELPFSLVKGQLIEMECTKIIPCSIMGQVYLVQNGKKAIVGATYEHDFTSPDPDPEYAKKELLPKLKELYPSLADAPITAIRAGIRASTPSRLPHAKQLGDKLYTLCGMGSRGLLYHAHFAEKLVESL